MSQPDVVALGMDGQNHWETIKCVVVGDGTVGKTCMLMRFKDKTFDPDYYIPTVFENYTVDHIYESIHYTLSLHDTAGHEDYDRLRPLSYSGTHVFLVCYSVVDKDAFANVTEKWLPELEHHSHDTPIVLVGTKLDLRKDTSSFIQKTNIAHVECSSLTGEGIEEVFQTAVRVALAGMAPKSRKRKTCLLL